MNRSAKVAAAVGAAVAAAAVAAAVLHKEPEGGTLDFEEGETSSDECDSVSVYGPKAAWQAIGVEAAGDEYGTLQSCAQTGAAAARDLGFVVLGDTPKKRPSSGQPKLKARTAKHADVDYDCACAAGPACEWSDPGSWTQAPRNRTLNPGRWRGKDCKRKTCVELLGVPSMPPECL